MTTLLLVGAGALLVAVAGLIGWVTVAALSRSRAQLRATRLELMAALQAVADAEAGKESALRLLEDQRHLRVEDLRTFHAQVQALHISYDAALNEYRAALAIDKPLASGRLQ